jgi:hypothetical protein
VPELWDDPLLFLASVFVIIIIIIIIIIITIIIIIIIIIIITVKPVLNGISKIQNIFLLKPGFRLIKVHYDSHGT